MVVALEFMVIDSSFICLHLICQSSAVNLGFTAAKRPLRVIVVVLELTVVTLFN